MRTSMNPGTLSRYVMVLVFLLAPAAIHAQGGDASADPDRTARVLEEEARTLSSSEETYATASDLFRKAAELRGEEDEIAVEDLRNAGRLAFYLGDHDQAIDDFRRAGELAVDLELASDAVDSYYQAAWIAWRADDHVGATRLLNRMTRLSRDPNFVRHAPPEVVARIIELRSVRG